MSIPNKIDDEDVQPVNSLDIFIVSCLWDSVDINTNQHHFLLHNSDCLLVKLCCMCKQSELCTRKCKLWYDLRDLERGSVVNELSLDIQTSGHGIEVNSTVLHHSKKVYGSSLNRCMRSWR